MTKNDSSTPRSFFYHLFITFFCFLGSFLLFLSLTAKTLDAQALNKVTIGGTIKVDVQHTCKKCDDPNISVEKKDDIVLSSLEIGLDAELQSSLQGHVLLLWEEDETEDVSDFIDEATVTIYNQEKCPYYLTLGKMYLPFGSFETSFITDPMTLELGEINETAVKMGYKKDGIDLSFGLFNGEIDKTGKDKINSYFAQCDYEYTNGQYNISAGISYLSNLLDSEGLQGIVEQNIVDQNIGISDRLQAMGVFMKADTGAGFLAIEYLGAIDNANSVLFGRSLRPEAYNLEMGWRSPQKVVLAIKYETSKDLEISESVKEYFNFPKNRYGITLSYPLFGKATLGFEYLYEKYKEVDKGKQHLLTAELAITF